jgi:hypothetical protein
MILLPKIYLAICSAAGIDVVPRERNALPYIDTYSNKNAS